MGDLTRNFSLSEFLVSSDYPHLVEGITVSPRNKEKIRSFCANVLQPLRNKLQEPVIITSGVRSIKLNSAVNGHPQSHHLFHYDHGACDIVCEAAKPETIATILINTMQVRYVVVYEDFLHISFADNSNIYNQVFHK